MKQKKILLVDDNPDILEAIGYLLKQAGYIVISVKNGDYFKNLDKKNLPDLILLDMLLSGTDGSKLAKKLKTNPQTSQIPIIMISAHPSAKEAAKKSGVNDFIAKPFDIEQLLEKIDKYTRIN